MEVTARVLRVFTRDDAGGNHLGFIDDFATLDATAMQSAASQLGYAETVFVDVDQSPPHVRIFTPGQELPFAGHPLVGTAWILLRENGTHVDRLRCGIGEVRIGLSGDGNAWIEADIDRGQAQRADLDDYAARAGLGRPERSWLVHLPNEYAIMEYPDVGHVASAAPDTGVLTERFGTMIVARTSGRARVRFFAPDAGVIEDAATGSAAVALATALVHDDEPEGEIVIHQGEEMGHPSLIQLRWSATKARIGGGCVLEPSRTINTHR